jgi:pilus assembly protein FimV
MAAKNLSRTVVLLLAASPAAFSLGLGDIRLLSSLNAPLDAEIELVGATPEELAGLKAQIASRETFARYKLDWPAFMGSITVQPVHTADGRDVIKLHSAESITEPFLTLLVEANWARGKLVREYTVLLDPPVYTPGQTSDAAPVAAPVTEQSNSTGSISRPTEPLRSSAQSVESTSAAASPSSEPSSSETGAGSTRLVRGGDTLSGIASEVAGSDHRAARRWMLAIYRANPRAFDGNMNILRRGAELQIPATAQNVSSSDASAEIRQQYTAWRGTTSSSPDSAAEPARLRLVPPAEPGAGAGTSSAGGGDSAALQGKVRELEAQLQESRRLIELRNAELARLQTQLAAKQGQPAATPPPPPSAEETPMEPPVAPTSEQTPPVEEGSTVTPAPDTEAQTAEPAKPIRPPTTAPAPAERSLLDTLKEYWWALAAILIALAALLGLRAWRARKQAEFDDSLGRLATAGPIGDFNTSDTAPIRALGTEPSFVVEESGTHERPRFGGEGAASAARNVTTDDTISSDTAINLDQGDPLAEADFHMAYGLYDQAADLVRIAIAREPERRDLKLKLLEVFFVWGNKDQFLQTAHELADSRDRAAPGEWEKIVIMGKQLAPDDELFAGGTSTGAAAGGIDLDLEGGQSRVDFDLLGEPLPSDSDGVDLDIGSALGDRDSTVESPTRTTDAHLALHDHDYSGEATTRQMTQRVQAEEPEPMLPDYGLESAEAPTVEQPAMPGQDNPTIRQKVDMALRQPGVEQTAELNIDDLGLDLTALDTVDQPGLGSSPDAPTMVAGLDEQSRRLMEDAERRDRSEDDEATGSAATGAWRVSQDDLDATMPPTSVQTLEGDVNATSRMAAIKETDLDFDFDSADTDDESGIDLDVGTATVPDASHAATQRISAEDLALPDLEPVTMSEVGTKLDLARAYMDMGDPEGARNILEEVLLEGSVTQKQEAQRLLESLPG